MMTPGHTVLRVRINRGRWLRGAICTTLRRAERRGSSSRRRKAPGVPVRACNRAWHGGREA